MYNKNMLSTTELGPQDLFYKWNCINKKTIPKISDTIKIQQLQEDITKQKEYIDYLSILLDNKEKEISKITKSNNTNLKIKNNVINILINTLKMHNIDCDINSINVIAKQK